MAYEAATVGHLHELLEEAAGGRRLPGPNAVYLHLAVQVQRGVALAVRDGGRVIALGGVCRPRNGMRGELWVAVVPGHRAAFLKHLLGVRPWLADLLRGPFADGLVTRVVPGNRAGETMARALGFSPGDAIEFGARIWRRGPAVLEERDGQAGAGSVRRQ